MCVAGEIEKINCQIEELKKRIAKTNNVTEQFNYVVSIAQYKKQLVKLKEKQCEISAS